MRRVRSVVLMFIFTASLLLLADCSSVKNVVLHPVDDKTLITEIQAKLFADPVLKARDIRVNAQNGVVTLAGTVNTELEKAATERFASQVEGVKSVANELTVGGTTAAGAPPAAISTAVPALGTAPEAHATDAKPVEKHGRWKSFAGKKSSHESAENNPPNNSPPAAEISSNPVTPPAQTPDEPAQSAPSIPAAAPVQLPSPPPPPPPPAVVTLPSGTTINIRMIDEIDSSRNQAGEEFAASVATPVIQDGKVVIPAGADARVRLVKAATAGRLSGQSELQVELSSVSVNNTTYNMETSVNQSKGDSRGTRTAEKVGGGSVLGALIGAIAGGGKGAAIGAGVGAAGGTAAQAGTKGQQVKIRPEAKLDFTLKAPITITLPQ